MKINFNKILFVVFMWTVFTILLLTTFGCSPQWHLDKAIKKGAKQQTDTAYQYIYDTDTIYNEVTKTFEVVRTKTDSIPYAVTTYITSPLTRRELKAYRDSLKHERTLYKDSLRSALKTKRIEYKTKVKIERTKSRWWVWVLVGMGIMLVLRLAWTYIKSFLISKLP